LVRKIITAAKISEEKIIFAGRMPEFDYQKLNSILFMGIEISVNNIINMGMYFTQESQPETIFS
jgi:hypothetical protein